MGFDYSQQKIPLRGRSNPHPGDKSVPWWGNIQYTIYKLHHTSQKNKFIPGKKEKMPEK
jgi:hypothetical protein